MQFHLHRSVFRLVEPQRSPVLKPNVVRQSNKRKPSEGQPKCNKPSVDLLPSKPNKCNAELLPTVHLMQVQCAAVRTMPITVRRFAQPAILLAADRHRLRAALDYQQADKTADRSASGAGNRGHLKSGIRNFNAKHAKFRETMRTASVSVVSRRFVWFASKNIPTL